MNFSLRESFPRWVDAYARTCQRAKLPMLALALLLVAAALWSATRLSVDPRIESLLPSGTDSALALSELDERLESTSPLYLLVQSSSLETSRQLARRLHHEVSTWPETRWAMYRRDASVFADNRLLYLTAEDIELLDEQIDDRERWESCAQIPGCSNLEKEPPPLPTDEDLQRLFEKDPDVRAMVRLFGRDSKTFVEAEPSAIDPAAEPQLSADQAEVMPDGESSNGAELGELCDVRHNVCSVHVAIDGNPGDLEFATKILQRSEALFEQVKAEVNDPEVRMAVSGRYRNLPVTKRMVDADLTKISLLSTGLILLVMLLQFRGLLSLVALFAPALIGIVWTAGLLGVFKPELNILSAFTLAVLAGVAIDFGVHLLTHYSEERERRATPLSALSATLEGLTPSLLVAAFTTSGAFAALGATSFHGFAEMGPIAAAGIVVSLVAFYVVFPPLALLLDRGENCPFQLRRYSLSPWRKLRRFASPIVLGGFAVTLALSVIGRDLEFEYDFSNLRPSGVGHGIPWGGTQHGTQRSSVYMLADDEASLKKAAAGIREQRPEALVRTDAPFVLVPAAFIPPDQPARIEALEQLGETLARAKRNASDELRAKIERFEPLTKVDEPLSVTAMPRWVTDWLIEKDGSFGTFGLVYADLSGSDAREMETLDQHIAEWRKAYPDVRFASEVALLGEVTPQLRRDAPGMLGLALLGVCLGTLAVGRSLRRLLLVLLPLAVMVGLSLGVAHLLGLRINLYNLLAFPLAFGIGVDGAVYVTWAMASPDPDQRLPVAARAVLGSTLTSMAGFGALMISNNPGLASIGHLVTLMLAASLIANLLWLPSLQTWRSRVVPRPS